MQNGTVKSNEELVKVLNAAEVPGTDVVGERWPAAVSADPPVEPSEAAERLQPMQCLGQRSNND